MRRDDPDVLDVVSGGELPAPAATIIERLGPLVTEARLTRMREVLARRTGTLVPILEDLADPHNGAAVLRSADAFGCQEVHVIERRHRFLISKRVSRGAHRWLELHRHPGRREAIEALRSRGFQVFVASMEGELDPEGLAAVPRAAVVFGNEHAGASEEVRSLADGSYRIPMVGFVESLNVSVASAITLYVATRGRHGDLDDAAREVALARYLLASVRDAERALERE